MIFVYYDYRFGTTSCKKIYDAYPSLEKDALLLLQRHPRNRYDKRAICIYYEKMRIGRVPRVLNLAISRLMDAGKAFFSRVENDTLSMTIG